LCARGHDASVVCLEGSSITEEDRAMAVSKEQLESPEFWRSLNADAAIVLSWLFYVETLEAIQTTEAVIVQIGDTDGMDSARVWPLYNLIRMWYIRRYLKGATAHAIFKIRRVVFWLRRFLYLYKSEDAVRLRTIMISHRTVLASRSAITNLAVFLRYWGARELEARIECIPYIVHPEILSLTVPPKRRKVVAIGRWDDGQKDALLLARTLELFLRDQPETEVVIIGQHGHAHFDRLAQKYQRFSYLGHVHRSVIASHLGEAQVVLITSRWESFHIGAHEGLCLGCTLVGPPVIPLPDICLQDGHGTMARRRDSRDLAEALRYELNLWSQGKRDGVKIAEFYRHRVSPKAVVDQYEGLLMALMKMKNGSS
jgi:glycosyltransferase involved in cell wall biosynthesis